MRFIIDPPNARQQSSASGDRDASSYIEVSLLADHAGRDATGAPLTYSGRAAQLAPTLNIRRDLNAGPNFRPAYPADDRQVAAGFFFLGFAAGFGSITGSDPRSTDVRRPPVKV
jgi:hypothetical protein